MWQSICSKIDRVYGKNYNGHKYKYDFFIQMVPFLEESGPVDYLELGSYEGVSLVTVAEILRSSGKLGRIVSIDPYFPDGYFETPPGQEKIWKNANSETFDAVRRLYEAAELNVDIRRAKSSDILPSLICENELFDLVFVDGNHEGLTPLFDIACTLRLMKPNGVLCLDDVGWPDVKPIAQLCERHLKLLFESKTQKAFRVGPGL